MKTITRIILLLLLNAWTLNAQETTSRQLLIDDFDACIRYVEETHPDPYSAYGGLVEFKRRAQNLRSQITESATENDLRAMLNAFVSRLEDAHTIIHSSTDEESASAALFPPLRLKTASDGIFVAATTAEHSALYGAEILNIDGRSIDEILAKIKQLCPVENRYGACLELCRMMDNGNAPDLLFDKRSSLPMTIRLASGKTRTLNVDFTAAPKLPATKSKMPTTKDNNLLYAQMTGSANDVGYFVWNAMSSREMVEEVAKNSPEYLDMNLNAMYSKMLKIPRPENDDEAVRNIPSLYGTFFNLLSTMKERKSHFLIIDLRHNGGGMTPLCRPLLYMMYGDKYLDYNCRAEYNVRLSSLLLKKWNVESIEHYNVGNKTNYKLGDFRFGLFFGGSNKNQPTEKKRKDLSLISYFNGIGKEYTENLDGRPVHQAHAIVLCSPETFSAAFHFLYLLKETGNATIVGVPSRQAGNTFMETTSFELPNTKITGSISNSIQIFFPDDPAKGKVLTPDFPMTGNDFRKYDFDENAELMYALDLIKSLI